MIGELGALETIIYPYTDDSPYTLHFGKLVIAFEVLFIILVPILLTNLLVNFLNNFLIIIVLSKFYLFKIGLAVGDIESIQKSARLKREAMQVFKQIF